MNIKKSILLAVLSGLLLALAWVPTIAVYFVFIAFVPLLWSLDKVERSMIKRKGRLFFLLPFTGFLVWNVLTTHWVFNATPFAVVAFLLNATLMALVYYLYYITKKHVFKGQNCYWVLIVYWIAFEFFHQNWDLSWPWLTLGNVFADAHKLIQFYDVTGVLGGSIWVYSVNILAFLILKKRKDNLNEEPLKTISLRPVYIAFLSVLLIPVAYSLIRYNTYVEKGKDVQVLVIQPNIDPYTEQYELNPVDATHKMLNLVASKITPQTRLIVTPESMIQEYLWETQFSHSPSINRIQEFLSGYGEVEMIAGLSTASALPKGLKTPAARKMSEDFYYEAHNTVLLISKDQAEQKYYKSKLTPGVEIMPFVNYFSWLEKLALDMGGTIGTLGISEERVVFKSQYGTPDFSDIICYESVYGDFVRRFVNNGAEFLCISTNDGWWGDTPGYRQHARYAKLRAIETRRDIARSANTGMSCFINQRGDVSEATGYWTDDAILQTIKARDGKTFYVKYGDYLGRMAVFVTCILLLLTLAQRLMRNKNVTDEKGQS